MYHGEYRKTVQVRKHILQRWIKSEAGLFDRNIIIFAEITR